MQVAMGGVSGEGVLVTLEWRCLSLELEDGDPTSGAGCGIAALTSPLKEFVRKGEHVLERSLSESRKEIRRGKNAEAADISGEIHSGRNGHVSGRASHGTSRSSQAASNGDVQNFRTDWLKNSKIGRSRSVHYTSPGNLDNGMLRFYLTPMRSTRTANRARRRSSRLFARGLFGFI